MGDTTPPWKSYRDYLDQECLRSLSRSQSDAKPGKPATIPPEAPMSVGIIGGGMAGLYSALLLQKHIPGVRVKIFEANNRVGGRVYTHKFSSEPYQYFDTGAMRLPNTEGHKPVLTLIEYLNRIIPDNPIKLMDYIGSSPEGNRVFYNGSKSKDGRIMSVQYANEHCSELGFPRGAEAVDGITADEHLNDALAAVEDNLQADFSTALKKYTSISLFDYLSSDLGWSNQKIRYVEAMTGHTSEFRREVVFEVLLRRPSHGAKFLWQTIEGGMSVLPERCVDVLLKEGADISLNSKVEAIEEIDGGSLRISYNNRNKDLTFECFDAIVVTIPPPNIRMIPKRPKWGADLEQAVRTAYFRDATKMIVRFKSRFWERTDLQLPPSLGGLSITDLPVICQILYPSHGLGDKGKGVLCVYTKGHDSEMFNLFPKVEQVKQVLSSLQLLYPEVDIAEEYAGGTDPEDAEEFLREVYIQEWPFCGVHFYPGDFLSLYSTLVCPRGNTYFAGSHLSPNAFWIVGALESAKRAVQQLVLRQSRFAEDVTYI